MGPSNIIFSQLLLSKPTKKAKAGKILKHKHRKISFNYEINIILSNNYGLDIKNKPARQKI